MHDFVVSAAGYDHIAAIPGIELAAASLFAEADLPLCLRFKTTAKEDLNYALENRRLWVAVGADEKVVGFAVADIIDGEAHLSEVDVMPEFGRLGIGTRLVQITVDWARELKFNSLSLVTYRHLPWNAPFYEKLCFDYVDAANYGPELAELFEFEKQAGIDTSKRVAMRLVL